MLIRLTRSIDTKTHEILAASVIVQKQTLEYDQQRAKKLDIRYKSQQEQQCHQAFKTSIYEEYKNINSNPVPGTCLWVQNHPRFKAWQQSTHHDLLWISADPGCGKSVLSKSLVDIGCQHADQTTVCYFFFKDNEQQNKLATALCALLHQLFD